MSNQTPTTGEQTLTPRIELPWTAKDADLLNEAGGKVAEFLFQQDARFAAAACNGHEALVEALADWIVCASGFGAGVESDVLAWAKKTQKGPVLAGNKMVKSLMATLAKGGTS